MVEWHITFLNQWHITFLNQWHITFLNQMRITFLHQLHIIFLNQSHITFLNQVQYGTSSGAGDGGGVALTGWMLDDDILLTGVIGLSSSWISDIQSPKRIDNASKPDI